MEGYLCDHLNDYKVSRTRGFLPSDDPLEKLPDLFKPLEDVAANLNFLLMTGRIQDTLQKMTIPDIAYLENRQQIQRAFLLLSVLSNASIWGNETPATSIPQPIAVPLCALAEQLDCPPITTYGAIVLDNWRRLDPSRPIALDNIATLQLFLGGLDEQWFYLIHVAIEMAGVDAVVSLTEIQKCISVGNFDAIALHLMTIIQALAEMNATLERMYQNCDPYIFYHRVRPFLASWPDPGVIYEGVSDQPKKFSGGSGAQSPLIQSLDAGLGIQYHSARGGAFLVEMRAYMSPEHRNFIGALEAGPSLRQFAIDRRLDYPILCDLYDNCIQALEQFRLKHMQIAACYISRQSMDSTRGTGGTHFTHLLNNVKQGTADHLIGDRTPISR